MALDGQFQVSDSEGRYVIGGTHDVDKGWMEDVRKKGGKIVPRILFDKWTGQHFMILFQQKEKQAELVKLLIKTGAEYKFDGFTVEVWSQLGGNARYTIYSYINLVCA